MTTDSPIKQVLVPCRDCLRQTTHDLLYQKSVYEKYYVRTFAMLQCCGCRQVCLAEQVLDPNDGSKEFKFYPPAAAQKKPSWLRSLTLTRKNAYIAALLSEIYEATHGGQNRLAAMGIRALLENLMISKVGDQGSFEKHLDEFHNRGLVSSIQKETLNSILQVGHGATHRSFTPKSTDITLALEIVEGVMAPIFHHHQAAEEVSSTVPARPPRKKPSPPPRDIDEDIPF
jgi:hypothetical protein